MVRVKGVTYKFSLGTLHSYPVPEGGSAEDRDYAKTIAQQVMNKEQ